MVKRFSLLLVALLVLGFAVAGCGGDDDGDNKASSTSATSTTPTETTAVSGGASDTTTSDDKGGTDTSSSSGTTTSGGSSSSGSNSAQVDSAIKQCKKSVEAAPQLKPDTKKKLADICEKAGSGDKEGLQEASKEVCLAIIEDTGISGPTAETAKQQCNNIQK